MKLILLPGNSEKNKAWINNVKKTLSDKFDNILSLEYEHWRDKKKDTINLDFELKKLKEIIDNLCTKNYIIFAKTAGVALTLKGIYEGVLDPNKCIFLGVPIIWARLHDFSIDDWFNYYEYPTLFIQKSGDPAMFHDDLKNYLEGKRLTEYNILKIDGYDMNYNEVELFKDEIIEYLDDLKEFIY